MKAKTIEVVAAIIRLKNGKVLIGKRRKSDSNAGKWEFPGGKINPGETAEQALRREIQEELDFHLPAVSFFDEVSHHYPHYAVQIKFYMAEVDGEFPMKNLSHEKLLWIDPAENSELDFLEANKSILEKLRQVR